MLVITCPHCGMRNANEFTFGGELSTRPVADADLASWRDYLYTRRNVAGWEEEQWLHVSGCRRLLVVERNTITNEIRSVRDVAGRER